MAAMDDYEVLRNEHEILMQENQALRMRVHALEDRLSQIWMNVENFMEGLGIPNPRRGQDHSERL